jgi:hypothetical protein
MTLFARRMRFWPASKAAMPGAKGQKRLVLRRLLSCFFDEPVWLYSEEEAAFGG